MISFPSTGEVGDGYSVRAAPTPYWCGHCHGTFPVSLPLAFLVHVPLCLQHHIDELHAHNMVARLDDTYRIPRQVGYRRIHFRDPEFTGGGRAQGWAEMPPEWLR